MNGPSSAGGSEGRCKMKGDDSTRVFLSLSINHMKGKGKHAREEEKQSKGEKHVREQMDEERKKRTETNFVCLLISEHSSRLKYNFSFFEISVLSGFVCLSFATVLLCELGKNMREREKAYMYGLL